MSEKANNKNGQSCEKDYKPYIEDFICDEYSVCREERQYAVFLYDVLRKYSTPESREGYNKKAVGEIFAACGLKDAVVEDVFYEATFMRDFFERNRLYVLDEKKVKERILSPKKFSSDDCRLPDCNDCNKECNKLEKTFNYKLIKYLYDRCLDKGKDEGCENKELCEGCKNKKLCEGCEEHRERNLGQKKIECKMLSVHKGCMYKARWMMNAKPDIAVIYHSDKLETKYLLFLECKFGSGESSYSFNGITMTQRKLQWMIADFLCKHYLKTEEITVSKKMENDESRLVQFTRDKKDKEKGHIFIGDLIRIERNIFS